MCSPLEHDLQWLNYGNNLSTHGLMNSLGIYKCVCVCVHSGILLGFKKIESCHMLQMDGTGGNNTK